jgi:hydroxymethylbilane synthase
VTDPPLRIATRGSDLAIWQAEHVAALLRAAAPGTEVVLVPVSTTGDRLLDVPIAELGGKGVFAKEVQAAVLDGRADLAVHSAKDQPAVTLDGLTLAAVPERGDARDALAGARLADLAPGAKVGTGSARRRVQLAARRPDLEYVGLRGNMAKRLSRLDDLDAVVVAAVALERLGLVDRIAEVFDVEDLVPQVGQGALAVECRSDDDDTMRRVAAIEHAPSRARSDAERAFLARLGGDCSLPAGAHARAATGGRLRLTGVLASEDETRLYRRELDLSVDEDPIAAGTRLADQLRADLG